MTLGNHRIELVKSLLNLALSITFSTEVKALLEFGSDCVCILLKLIVVFIREHILLNFSSHQVMVNFSECLARAFGLSDTVVVAHASDE